MFKQSGGARDDDRKCLFLFFNTCLNMFKQILESGDRKHMRAAGGFTGTSPTKPAPSTVTRRLRQNIKRSRVKGQTCLNKFQEILDPTE
jgi:hypothetical protein